MVLPSKENENNFDGVYNFRNNSSYNENNFNNEENTDYNYSMNGKENKKVFYEVGCKIFEINKIYK